MILTKSSIKLTGRQWAEWAGVSERTAQSWLRGSVPAPVWAMAVAVRELSRANSLNSLSRLFLANEFMEKLAANYAAHGASGRKKLIVLKGPSPCPWCGHSPEVGPPDASEGSCRGFVACVNQECAARPRVGHGCNVNDERGIDAYKALAIERWNQMAVAP